MSDLGNKYIKSKAVRGVKISLRIVSIYFFSRKFRRDDRITLEMNEMGMESYFMKK